MALPNSYCPPRRWLRMGKYLLPLGMPGDAGPRIKPPRVQVRVADLATDYPECVTLHAAGKAEARAEYSYQCHSEGQSEIRTLPVKFDAAPFVAELENGISFGRHCCVIGPDGKAMQETGFNLAGVLSHRVPVSKFRPHYWRKRWEGDITSRPWLPRTQRIEGSVAVLNTRFSHNFYHWLIDILPRVVPLRRVGIEPDFYLIDCLTNFQKTVLATFGIDSTRLIQPHCRLLLEAEQLLVPSLPTPDCLREFGKLLLSVLGVNGPVTTARRIFISRRKSKTRKLANETELEQLLHWHGFETHCLEDYSLAKQARLLREAEIIVATHGAGLANLLFARPGTQVIEICPTGRFNATIYPEKSRIFGLEHQIVFTQRARHRQILRVSLEDVAAALEIAKRKIPRALAA
jgi:capsular polysaccharide biosynthesis protein